MCNTDRRIYLYSLTRQFFLSESVLVANPELGVSRTEGRLSRSGPETCPGYSCYNYICRDGPSFRTGPLHITVSFPRYVRTVFLFYPSITVGWLAFRNVYVTTCTQGGSDCKAVRRGVVDSDGNKGCARSRQGRSLSQTGCSTKSLKKVLARL